MGCKNYCLYGQNACCLECQIKDQCNIQCDDIDSYEYAVECPDYVKKKMKKITVETLEDYLFERYCIEGDEKLGFEMCIQIIENL